MAVVIEDGLAPAMPLTHARIGWHTVATAANVSSSGAVEAYPETAAVNPLTYDLWLPDALPATWQVDAGAAVAVDYVGIAAHTLADGLLTVTVQHSADGTAWTDVIGTAPADNGPILFLFAPVTARYWRLLIDGGSPQFVGVVYIGQVLAMARPIYGDVKPLALNRATTIQPQSSEKGQFLGRSVVRGGQRTAFAWRHLGAAWYRANFDPFVEAAIKRAFFIAWRPSRFPDDIGYVWTDSDQEPNNMGVRDFMTVALPVEGIGTEPAAAFVFDLDESYVAADLEEVDLAGGSDPTLDLTRFSAVVGWTATGSEADGTRVVEWNDGTADNLVTVSRSGANVALNVVVSGGFVASIALGAWSAGDHLAAIRAAEDDFAGSLDGAGAVTDSAGAMPAVDTMMIAHTLGPSFTLGGAGDVAVRLTQGVLGDDHLETYSGG